MIKRNHQQEHAYIFLISNSVVGRFTYFQMDVPIFLQQFLNGSPKAACRAFTKLKNHRKTLLNQLHVQVPMPIGLCFS